MSHDHAIILFAHWFRRGQGGLIGFRLYKVDTSKPLFWRRVVFFYFDTLVSGFCLRYLINCNAVLEGIAASSVVDVVVDVVG